MELNIDWEPQERQLVCLKAVGLSRPFIENLELRPSGSLGEDFKKCIADIVGYGGAAGGGKTDTLCAIALVASIAYPGIQIAYFRRKFPSLEGLGGAINRSQEMIPNKLATYNKTSHTWSFKNGSIWKFCHCQNPGDELNYKSNQFDILLVDEGTEFLGEQLDFLITRNRGTLKNCPNTFRPFTVIATNPGDVGHTWYKDRFITIGKPETILNYYTETGEVETHYFVPSKLSDNQILELRDPAYRRKLSRTEQSRKVYLEGDWDSFKGQAFSELRRDIHVIKPFEIPEYWKKFGAYDHGFNHPFSFGIYAVDDDGVTYKVRLVTDRFKRVDEISRMMKESIGTMKLDYIVAGHDCWANKDGNPTIAEQFRANDIFLKQANIDRVQGVNQIRKYIAWKNTMLDDKGNMIDGKPMFYFFENCIESYNVIATMVFDDNKPEDVKKVDADEQGKGGDDQYDETRYGLMSRPRPAIKLPPKINQNTGEALINEIQNIAKLNQQINGWR